MTTNTNAYNKTDTRSLNASGDTNAALRGAALAFAKPPGKPNPNLNPNSNPKTRNGRNGALAAATLAESASYTNLRARVAPQVEGNGINESIMPQYSGTSNAHGAAESGSDVSSRNRFSKGKGIDHLALPPTIMSRSKSPSHIAATIAASKSGSSTPSSPSRKPIFSPALPGTSSSSGRSSARSDNHPRDMGDDIPDTTPIPPTMSLIGMFEKSAGTDLSVTRQADPDPRVDDMKPSRRSLTGPIPMRTRDLESPKPMMPIPMRIRDLESPKSLTSISMRTRDLESPKSMTPVPSGGEPGRSSRTPSLVPKNTDNEAISSDDSFVSARAYRPHSAPLRRPISSSTSPNTRSIDAMANAIVASSLASSRAASPSKPGSNLAPPPPPPRHSSPAKGLRATMRKAPKEDDPELLKRSRKNIMKKHPNKHREGDRKRWRDRITERERKRYEAVWASNRGVWVDEDGEDVTCPLSPSFGSSSRPSGLAGNSTSNNGTSTGNSANAGASDAVSNIIVRDIWSRSRLGNDILSEVWELVDRTNTRRLSREEFVVGMWLIDQRLKGRKLPVRVGESVWGSLGLGGVRVRGR